MKKDVKKIWEPGFVKLMLESIGDGVFTLNDGGRITSWNPSMERITGYTAEEAIGESCRLIAFSSCFGRDCPAGIRECGIYKYGKVEPLECTLRHKKGHEVPIIKSARVMKKNNGDVIGIVETLTDLTELKKTREAMEEANRRLVEFYRFDNIIGKSNAMREIFTNIKAAANSEATILLQGESGTGKEIVAGAIHHNSNRKDKPLVVVNCSALTESLLESELFGHVKGAFTGANYSRTGRFEEADGGTVFLDEIGEISPLIQVKLLRVIQEREIERVGESKKRKINIRIITATNKDLFQLTQEGLFREDLYYRLKVFPIHLPPLRDRKEDIPLLIDHFIDIHNRRTGKNIKRLEPSVMRVFENYRWPGNIRELEHAIEHAFVIAATDTITLPDIPVEISRNDSQLTAFSDRPGISGVRNIDRKSLTKELLTEVLADSDWNKAEVGRRLGMSRASVWKYMKKWGIPNERPEPLS